MRVRIGSGCSVEAGKGSYLEAESENIALKPEEARGMQLFNWGQAVAATLQLERGTGQDYNVVGKQDIELFEVGTR